MIEYGGISHDEMEVTIRLERKDRQAHACSTWREWSRRVDRLYGSPKRVTNRDGKMTSAFWTVPLNRVSLRRGPRILTETQRQEGGPVAASQGTACCALQRPVDRRPEH